ncbi:MAG: acyl carrier protein [Parahaliea sp.]
MDIETLKYELKQLIVDECDVDISASEIQDDEMLMGELSRLDLDSLDALSISLEIKHRYGKHIDSGNETRTALRSVDTLAQFVADSGN